MLGALCNAVQRGVDVRFMVDSIGSISLANRKMMALESCAQNAGYLRDENGRPTKYKARVQTVIFNSLTNTLGSIFQSINESEISGLFLLVQPVFSVCS